MPPPSRPSSTRSWPTILPSSDLAERAQPNPTPRAWRGPIPPRALGGGRGGHGGHSRAATARNRHLERGVALLARGAHRWARARPGRSRTSIAPRVGCADLAALDLVCESESDESRTRVGRGIAPSPAGAGTGPRHLADAAISRGAQSISRMTYADNGIAACGGSYGSARPLHTAYTDCPTGRTSHMPDARGEREHNHARPLPRRLGETEK